MQFDLSEDQQQIKLSVREFAHGEIAPHVRAWDEAQHFPVELLPKLAEQGFMGVIFPEEYGGGARGSTTATARSSMSPRRGGSRGGTPAASAPLPRWPTARSRTRATAPKAVTAPSPG